MSTLIDNLRNRWFEESTSYVKDGLVLWLDGIDNTRHGHDDTSTKWEDLSGGMYDYELKDTFVINADSIRLGVSFGYAIRSAFELAGSSYYTPKTLEILVTLIDGSGPVFTTKKDNIGLAFYTDNRIITYFGAGVNAKPMFKDSSQESYKSLYSFSLNENSINTHAYRDGVEIEQLSDTEFYNHNTTDSYIGRRLNGATAKADFFSIRLYDRALTQTEVAHNYTIDKLRFNIS